MTTRMIRLTVGLLGLGVLCLGAPGCGVPEDGDFESEILPVLVPNALVPNALVPNALVPNALVPNALVPNALVPNALVPNALAALQDPGAAGEASRQFVKYAVGCALSPSQSFSFSWTDSSGAVRQETYQGGLGIAPEWATGPLSAAGQEWVTSCLIARVNALGVSVVVSLRAPLAALTPTASEMVSHTKQEAGFYGNVFAATPKAYACVGANSTSAALTNRLCSSSTNCGAIALAGICGGGKTGACASKTNNNFGNCYASSSRTGTKYTRVITTYLQ